MQNEFKIELESKALLEGNNPFSELSEALELQLVKDGYKDEFWIIVDNFIWAINRRKLENGQKND